MRKQTKVLLTMLCAVLLVVSSVFATMAYFTDFDSVENTFAVGKVGISLDEAKVDEYGEEVAGAARVKNNEYKLIPGHTYTKDPKVTVDADSESAYVRMKVKVDSLESLKAALPKDKYPEYYAGDVFLLQMLCNWDEECWNYAGFNSDTYEFRYYQTVSTVDSGEMELHPLFTTITVPGVVDNAGVEQLAKVKIVVTAEAIQADGFANADAAWGAFAVQHP